MKILEFEKKVGLSRDTLRYYEKIGLLTRPERASNGYRNYGQTQINELLFIERGKAIGFTLSEIRSGYEAYKKRGELCPQFRKQLLSKKAMLTKRISEDQSAIDEIDKMLK
ncbi:MerR family transcriptional regulator [Alteromonas gracilis]|uniref:MerR family transcriptional regulator n=1 Tax=Alteromonas gracilis TaxID=1479524 RepID=UPI0037358993